MLQRVLAAGAACARPAANAARRGAWARVWFTAAVRLGGVSHPALASMSSFAGGGAGGGAAAAPVTRHVRGGTIEVVPGAAQPYDSLVVISRE
jgi:hypothetical protein